MKMTPNTAEAIVNALTRSRLPVTDVRIEDADEYILRYEFGSYTVSIYFPSDADEVRIGWVGFDGRYHLSSVIPNLSSSSRNEFLVNLTIELIWVHRTVFNIENA